MFFIIYIREIFIQNQMFLLSHSQFKEKVNWIKTLNYILMKILYSPKNQPVVTSKKIKHRSNERRPRLPLLIFISVQDLVIDRATRVDEYFK